MGASAMMISTNVMSRSSRPFHATFAPTTVYVDTRIPHFMSAMRTSYNASRIARQARWIEVCDWFMLTASEKER